jgi:SAM-dependent methyltransferase
MTGGWASPPVDDVGYLSSEDLLKQSDITLLDLAAHMRERRYGGWRNFEGRWRDVLGLDTTRDKIVLDYGCGVGVEALEYGRTGNLVLLADIVPSNIDLARRIFQIHGHADKCIGLPAENPLPIADEHVDVVHCSGVLHHIPAPRPVVEDFHRILKPGGELRLMLYSDDAWRDVTGTEPPQDVTSSAEFEHFVRHFDGVGEYADWYDAAKLEQRFGDLFHIDRFEYLTENSWFIGAVLSKIEAG